MPRISIKTIVKADKKIVFDLSRSIDLHVISTVHTNERAIAGKTEGLINLNESVTWEAKHLGFKQHLTSKVTELESPNYFVDEMEKGAFKRFRHEHIFSDSSGWTIMQDEFDYTSPIGLLGKIADYLFLKKYMTRLLEKRNMTIKDFAESDKWKEVLNKNT